MTDVAALVLTLLGDDRPGLVDAVSRVVCELGGNWERSQMARLGGKFAVAQAAPIGPSFDFARLREDLYGVLDLLRPPALE